MTFTGTMIEDLIATVERAEQRAQRSDLAAVKVAGATQIESALVEPTLVEPVLNQLILGESIGAEAQLGEAAMAEPWLASVQENVEYDSKFLGVA